MTWRRVLARLAAGVPALLVVTGLVFAIVRLIPGDPARILAGDFATDQMVRELRERWQLDRPWPVQYVTYLRALHRYLPSRGGRSGRALPPHARARRGGHGDRRARGGPRGRARRHAAGERCRLPRHRGRPRGRVHAHLLVGADPDLALLRATRVAPRGRHGRPRPPRVARGEPGALRRRRDRAPDALEHARGPRRGVRAHRALQGV